MLVLRATELIPTGLESVKTIFISSKTKATLKLEDTHDRCQTYPSALWLSTTWKARDLHMRGSLPVLALAGAALAQPLAQNPAATPAWAPGVRLHSTVNLTKASEERSARTGVCFIGGISQTPQQESGIRGLWHQGHQVFLMPGFSCRPAQLLSSHKIYLLSGT